MNIDSALKRVLPQGMKINDEQQSTAPLELTAHEINASLSFMHKRQPTGANLIFSKYNLSNESKTAAIASVYKIILDSVPKSIRKAAGKRIKACARVMALFAVSSHIMSSETGNRCIICNGIGHIKLSENDDKHAKCEGCKGKGTITRCRCGGTGKIMRRIDSRRIQKGGSNICTKCNGKGHSTIKAANLRRAIEHAGVTVKADSFSRHWWL